VEEGRFVVQTGGLRKKEDKPQWTWQLKEHNNLGGERNIHMDYSEN
jgi:hypothetical protein